MSVFHFTKLREHTEKIGSGVTPQGGEASYKSQGIPLIRSQNVRVNRLDLSDVALIDQDQHNKMSGSKVVPGDVLLNITGASIGRSCVVPHNVVESNVNQHVCIIRPKASIDARFLSLFLNSWFGQKQICSFQGGGSREALNFQQIGKFDIPTPPIPEQKAIAALLSTWDEAIEKTERLVKAKEMRFKWLLRELISEPRNTQKGTEWKKVKLGDIGEICSAGVDKKLNNNEISVRLLNYLDVYRRDFVYSSELTHEVTAPKTKAEKCDIRKGDVFFTPSSEVRGDVAYSAVAMEDIANGVYSYHIVRFRLHENIDLLYRAYAFKSSGFFKQAYKYCEGSGQRYVISQSNFRKIEILLPTLERQKEIAEILSYSQREIKMLKQLADKYKTQKHGLMQKMLTGQWRLNGFAE